jgi:hypothetical protein
MTETITGGCRCGAVRYEYQAEPMFPGFCHCRACQKTSGAPHTAAFAIPRESLRATGKLTRYEDKADSGGTVRTEFCPTCGSRVLGGSSNMPDLAVIFATSLDDPSGFKPGMHVFTDSAQPWDSFDDGLPKFPAMPQMA